MADAPQVAGMTVTDDSRCPRCGAALIARAGGIEVCARCLLTTALSLTVEACPYEVMAPMDEDGAGVTYLAREPGGTGAYAALKLYGPQIDVEAVLSRYRRWKPALDRLRHPGVARLLDVGLTAEGRLYVASEYVAGWPLTTLRAHPSVGASERAELSRQLTESIAAAHAAGVVHLRLTASRVKISTATGPRATVLGFGSALVIDGADGSPDCDRQALAQIIGVLLG
jgi:eukaryotic-like serine/threonine-protein kinase